MSDRVHTNASFQRVAPDDPSVAWEFDSDDPRVAHLVKPAKAAEPKAEEAPSPPPARKKA